MPAYSKDGSFINDDGCYENIETFLKKENCYIDSRDLSEQIEETNRLYEYIIKINNKKVKVETVKNKLSREQKRKFKAIQQLNDWNSTLNINISHESFQELLSDIFVPKLSGCPKKSLQPKVAKENKAKGYLYYTNTMCTEEELNLLPGHGRNIFVHRFEAAKKYGRPIKSEEIVRHVDGNKQNNDWDNLILGTPYDNSMDNVVAITELRKWTNCALNLYELLIANNIEIPDKYKKMCESNNDIYHNGSKRE